MISIHITSFGLILDIIGALLLIKFGIPPKIDREGHILIALEGVDEAEILKAKIYDRWSTFSIILIVLGFILQLIGNCI